jgi:hypothetical protein
MNGFVYVAGSRGSYKPVAKSKRSQAIASSRSEVSKDPSTYSLGEILGFSFPVFYTSYSKSLFICAYARVSMQGGIAGCVL